MPFNHRISALTAAALLIPIVLVAQEAAPELATATVNASGTSMLDSMPPEIQFTLLTLGSGGIAGWAVGYTLKKFAKLLYRTDVGADLQSALCRLFYGRFLAWFS